MLNEMKSAFGGNIKKFLVGTAAGVILLGAMAVPALAAGGFNQYGYNYGARLFNGTGMSWCLQKGINTVEGCEAVLGGPFTNDKLVMKWSKGWDDAVFGPDGIRYNGDELPWTSDAWEDNEWNGMMPGGSQAVWHYKIIWVGTPTNATNPLWRDGGYPIWGVFEVIMDQGVDKAGAYPPCDPNNGGHSICALATPNGYGTN